MAVPSSSFVVDNPGDGVGDTSPPVNYEVCDYSGFRAKPGTLQETWDGLMVLPEFWHARHDQDFVRSRPEQLNRGAIRPDDTGRELTYVAISPSDLQA